MKALLSVLGAIAMLLFIFSCGAALIGVHNGVQQYNQQNPTCQLSNPNWPYC